MISVILYFWFPLCRRDCVRVELHWRLRPRPGHRGQVALSGQQGDPDMLMTSWPHHSNIVPLCAGVPLRPRHLHRGPLRHGPGQGARPRGHRPHWARDEVWGELFYETFVNIPRRELSSELVLDVLCWSSCTYTRTIQCTKRVSDLRNCFLESRH